MDFLFTLFALIPFYLIGAFPTGYLIAKRAGVNIAEHGSGNVGATNIGRVLGKKAGIVVLCGDIAKGIIGVTIAYAIARIDWFPGAAAVALVAGHCFSIPGKLRGGKGVATGAAVALSLAPWVGLGSVLLFAMVFVWRRTVSLASVVAALSTPIFAMLLQYEDWKALALAVVGVIIVYRHRENLTRIVQGTEPRYELSKLKG